MILPAAVATCLDRLVAALGMPFGANAAALVSLWSEKLADLPEVEVRAAVEHWIETETKFPTIPAIRAATKARLGPVRYAGPAPAYVCPRCETEPVPRVWPVEARGRRDDRPVISVLDGESGRETVYVLAARLLCDCEAGRLLRDLSPEQQGLLNNPDLRATHAELLFPAAGLRLLKPGD